MLFSATFEVPLSLPKAQAQDFQRHVDLVSIIVDAQVYPQISDVLARYAKRIQQQLPNTRTLIFPLARDTQPQFIAALNEKLYWDGEPTTRAENTVEQLVGTVLVGDIALPVVHKGDKSFASIYPYVDFKDKAFQYNFSTETFEATETVAPDARPEIWHGVVAPHTGNIDQDTAKLREFFDKTERAYGKTDEFSAVNPTKPYVFWFDSVKEAKAVVPSEWQSYNKLYLPNLEDITYQRYTKYLAKYVYDGYQKLSTDPTATIVPFAQWNGSLSGDSGANFPLDGLPANVAKQIESMGSQAGGGPDMTSVPDIATKEFISKSAKRFAEVINAKYLGDMAKYVYGAGRYNEGQNAHVDTPAVLITKKDTLAAATLKDANTLLEKAIDSFTRKNLAQDIPALEEVKEKIELYEPVWHDWDECISRDTFGGCATWKHYRNFLFGFNQYAGQEFSYRNYRFGKDVGTISTPEQCSIVRGSSLTGSQYLVEANAAYNPLATQRHVTDILGDIDGLHPNATSEIVGNTGATTGLCMNYDENDAAKNGFKTVARWGGNSPLNAEPGSIPTVLQSQSYTSFYQPILDIGGSRQLTGSSVLTIASPLDCAKTDLLLRPYSYTLSKWTGDRGNPSERIPTRWRAWPRDSAFLIDTLKNTTREAVDNAKLGQAYSCATRFDLTTENDAIFNAYSQYRSEGDSLNGKAFNLTPTSTLSKNFAQLVREGLCVNPTATGSQVTCTGFGSARTTDYGFSTEQLPGFSWVALSTPIPAWGQNYSVASTRIDGQPVGVSGEIDSRLPTDGTGFKRQGITSLTFHRVESVLPHTSPTDEEYGIIAKNMATPSLPVDRDHYVAFISTQGTEEKITYPNFFRITLDKPEDFTPEKVDAALKTHLDAVSATINTISDRNDPAKADANARTVRQLMGGSLEKAPSVDLYAQLQSNKELHSVVVESILWKNLANAPAKYGYILENWLDREGRTGISPALNPSHRKDGYEISYLAGQGSADRLRLDVDPERADAAGGDVSLMLARNARFENFRRASNLAQGGVFDTSGFKTSKVFNCGPAEGVVITKWIPAIMCWLKENMPPKIKWAGRRTSDSSLTDGISSTPLVDGPDLSQDNDGNGLPDAYESAVKNAHLVVSFAKETYNPGTSLQFEAGLKDKDGNWLSWDQRTLVNLAISKIETQENGKTVTYVPGADPKAWTATVSQFVNFTARAVRVVDGHATYALSGKGKEAIIWVTAEIRPQDKNGDIVTNLVKHSDPASVEFQDPTLRVSAAAGDPLVSGADYVAGEGSIRFTVASADERKKPILPLTVSVTERDSSAVLQTWKIAGLSNGTYDYRWNDANAKILSKAGEYEFRFEDKRGFSDTVFVTVVPAEPSQLVLTTTSDVLVKNVSYNGILKLEDKFGNLVAGHPKPAALRVTGSAKITIGDGVPTAVADPYLFEGFVPVRLQASEAGDVTLSASIITDTTTLSTSVPLRVVDSAKASLTFENGLTPTVGGLSYPFTIAVTDGDGNALPINTIATFHFPESLGKIEPSAVVVEKGIARAVLVTGFVAARQAEISVDIPGVSSISGSSFAVFPGVPMTVDVRATRSELAANGHDITTVQAVLLDRYGNTVFKHDPSYKASVAIHNSSSLEFVDNQPLTDIPFIEGETRRLTVRSTQFAGTSYVTATVMPALE